MDAICIDSQRPVFLKRVEKASDETTVIKHLSSAGLRSSSKNHSVPLLDIIEGEDMDYLVMPLLRRFFNPPFYYVEEVVDFVGQTLEVCFCYLMDEKLTVFVGPCIPS